MIGQTLEQNLLLSDLMKISSVLPLQNYFDTKYIYFWKPKFPNFYFHIFVISKLVFSIYNISLWK